MEAIAVAAIELIGQIAKMIEDAKTAKDEKHAAILARLQSAQLELNAAQADAHQALEDELAADASALEQKS